ncbi:Calreticulin family protein [Histomonas meleagridis]|uniref:Calreticulin family protein n=1 Tax=Histomonas meleagridis TaxID=135588 RepID=UPI00355AC294|nr:Calreticulin family protein [Histomonas meleagridis]KAH0805735.1 Calreticulin family protein [Histomonas meleagridis]
MFFLFLLQVIESNIYFEENFDDDDWEQRWVQSKAHSTRGEIGTFRLTSGSYYGNQSAQKGIQTIDSSASYQISSKFKESFNTSGKDFILQFTIKFENGYECSGGYVKLLSSSLQPFRFGSKSQYSVMFGPDLCKPNKDKLTFIINRNGTYYDNHKILEPYNDELTHSYTLIIFANQSYEIRLDGKKSLFGNLTTDFELGGPEYIPDLEESIPENWDNREFIPDPNDWDDQEIPNPKILEIPNFDENINGQRGTPKTVNPDYKGKWSPKLIKNPNYMGEWTPRMIKNPSHIEDKGFGVFDDLSYFGIEVYQKTPGSIFDNLLVTDDLKYAEEKLTENFLRYKDLESSMYKRVLQDRAAEKELKKLRERERQMLTEDEFYTQNSQESETTSSIDYSESETDENFDFPSSEITDPPKASDFKFPYDVDYNPYFIAKKKNQIRKSSFSEREKWRAHREMKRKESEVPEEIPL